MTASPTPFPAAASAPPLAAAPGDTLPAAPSEPEGTPTPALRAGATPAPSGHVDPATGVRIEDQATPPPTRRRGSRSHVRTPQAQARPEAVPEARVYEPRPEQPLGGASSGSSEATRDGARDGSAQPSAPEVRTTVRRAETAVVLPEGTELPIRLDQTLASDTSRPEQDVTAELAQDVRVNGRVVLPAGSEVLGHVVVAQPSGRVRGRARLVVAFDEVRDRGRSLQIEAWRWEVTAESSRSHDSKIAGGAAVAGAIIGAITGGVKGALKGGILGGAAGGAAVLVTRGKEVEIRAGTGHTISLRKALRIE